MVLTSPVSGLPSKKAVGDLLVIRDCSKRVEWIHELHLTQNLNSRGQRSIKATGTGVIKHVEQIKK